MSAGGPNVSFVNLTAHRLALQAVNHAARPVAPTDSGHPALYETCAALIIAVLVVLYFDERVRSRLTPRQRGRAIGSLGGVIGTGLLICLFALAGFVPDTTTMRAFVTGYTLVFLMLTFGTAISIWGREDGAQLRQASQPRPAAAPAPASVTVPRGGTTERERAAEVFGTALAIVGQTHPMLIRTALAKTGPAAEAERLRGLTAQWLALQPALIATSAGYPSAEFRESAARFLDVAAKAMAATASLFADEQMLMSEEGRAQWQEEATAAYTAVDDEWSALVRALHAEESPRTKPRRDTSRPGNGSATGRDAASVHVPPVPPADDGQPQPGGR